MRRRFAELMHGRMAADKRIHFCTADVGYGMLDRIRDDFPTRFHNFGASEQLMIGAAVGLALSGKTAVCYTISPFLLYRPYEWIRNFMSHEHIPVKLVGSGRDKDYLHDGFTHWESHCFNYGVNQWYPRSQMEMETAFNAIFNSDLPEYLNLKR